MHIPQWDGRYEFERELGGGVFSVAFLARDTDNHSRRVVFKVLLEAEGQTFDDASFRIRFERETKALALIDHPYVVRVYEHGWTPKGSPYIVMQYVKGKSLRKAMRKEGMELGRAARIVEQLGSALSAVHDKGVVHRDLKPENVILQSSRDDEFAILIDFGVATVEGKRARRRGQETWAGTPVYMAPEQMRSRPCPASDVWALGVLAYELVTGQKPFSVADVLALYDTPQAVAVTKPKALRPELPEAAQAVILKALSYDPAQRYAHAHEMGRAFLRAVSDVIPTPPRPTQPVSETPTELLRRCQELFASLDEFRNPDSLQAFFSVVVELRSGRNCVGKAARLEFDQLLACLYRSGRDYSGQALVDLLSVLASRYEGEYAGRQCELLRDSLKRLLEQPSAAGR